MRKFIFALILLFGVIFIIGRLAELQAIIDTLQSGDWRFVILALAVQAIWMLNVTASYRTIFKALGLEETFSKLLVISTAANFVNVVAPSAGIGGVAVFVSEARRQSYSTARATLAGALYVLFDYAGFLVVLALGMLVLFRRNNVTPAEIIATGVLVLVAGILATLLYLGMRSADGLGSALGWMAHVVNRLLHPFIRREYLSEIRAHEFALDAAQGLVEVHHSPENLLRPAILALSNKGLLISVLLLMFMAFQVPVSVGTLIASFSIGYLFFIVSPTPSGIGIVEGVMTLAMSSMYIPLGAAAVIALAYRGITFWIPLTFGGIALRILHHRQLPS